MHDPLSLDSMGIKLVNPLGKELKVAFMPNTYVMKKKKPEKELQRLATTVNYGGPKGFQMLN